MVQWSVPPWQRAQTHTDERAEMHKPQSLLICELQQRHPILAPALIAQCPVRKYLGKRAGDIKDQGKAPPLEGDEFKDL
eukprot:1157647-Pelagomonas_calceolata.AAC.4